MQTNFKIIDTIRWYIGKSKALWESGGSKRPSSRSLEERRDQILDAIIELDELITWIKIQEAQVYHVPKAPASYKRTAVIG